jgi:ribosomal protein S18 acetylase RimI-like enzyme
MTGVRKATGEDIGELVRLRAILFDALGNLWGPAPDGGGWRDLAAASFADLLAGDEACVLVVPADDGPGLAACGVCLIDRRLPSPYNPKGTVAHILGMVTDPAYRKRGHARAIMRELVRWCDGRGIGRIDLNASPDGLGLYREMGFREHPDPTMSRRPGASLPGQA